MASLEFSGAQQAVRNHMEQGGGQWYPLMETVIP